MSTIVLVAAAGYLLGSIPFGYLLVRIFRGEDVRQSGSGNIGATNVSRKSPALGVLTFLLDAAQGTAPWRSGWDITSERIAALRRSRLSCDVHGRILRGPRPHVSLWLKFRGGKGVATAAGSIPGARAQGGAGAAGYLPGRGPACSAMFLWASIVAVAFFPGCWPMRCIATAMPLRRWRSWRPRPC